MKQKWPECEFSFLWNNLCFQFWHPITRNLGKTIAPLGINICRAMFPGIHVIIDLTDPIEIYFNTNWLPGTAVSKCLLLTWDRELSTGVRRSI